MIKLLSKFFVRDVFSSISTFLKARVKDDSKSIFFEIFFSFFVITLSSKVSLKFSIISNSNEIG